MGSTVSAVAVSPANDARVEKCIKKLSMSEDEVSKLFLKFCALDRDGMGLMTRNDFFSKFVEEERHFFGDAIFNLIEPNNEEVLTFGEFLEGICLYCLFETHDVLRLVFAVFDLQKTGFIAKDDLRHFIMLLHDGNIKSNTKIGMKYIQDINSAGGLVSFKNLIDLHKKFPSLLFPIFRMQITLMQKTFSERWWSRKKVGLAESLRIRKKLEEAQSAKGAKEEQEELMQNMIKTEMGPLMYYIAPWERKRVQNKIEKRKQVEDDLMRKEELGFNDEDGANFELVV